MRLRICDAGHERFVPASVEAVEQAFASGQRINDGTEITVAEGDRWLTVIAVGTEGDAEEFLLSGALGDAAEVSGRVARSEALRRFRDFVVTSGRS